MRYVLFVLLIGTFCACGDDDPVEPSFPAGPANATAISLIFVGPDDQPQTFEYRTDIDIPDGEIADPPEVDEVVLEPNTTYTLRVSAIEESIGSAGSSTRRLNDQIEAQAEDYIVLYSVLAATLDFDVQDLDANGDPIGLQSLVTTGGPSQGVLTLQLKYEAQKSSPSASGTTLIEADFPLRIE